MKVRNIINNDIVWFGSQGKDSNGNKIAADNYAINSEAIRCDLLQKLQILKGELFYNTQLGIPLFDKNKSKGVLDAYIISEISNNKGIKEIVDFKSYKNNTTYHCSFIAKTIYNEEISGELF